MKMTILIQTLLFVPVLIVCIDAKKLYQPETDSLPFSTVGFVSHRYVLPLESRLRRYFSIKADKQPFYVYDSSVYVPSDAELFMIRNNAQQFSPDFMMLYKQAVEKNGTQQLVHRSPGGHFNIHYDIQGIDAVEHTDMYGYGSGTDWRVKTAVPNNIPDYIDEVAWAFDSAWAMEIDRFGFPQPSAKSGEPYAVYVCALPPSVYGQTFWTGAVADTVSRHASFCEIRNNWNGWNLSAVIDYETNPQKAIRITAAHEFFHAVQYEMARHMANQAFFDMYPISWLEGSAVMMEEIGFDYVDDYTQYLKAFFFNPTASMFESMHSGVSEYKTVLMALYLYECIGPQPDIGFIKNIFTDNGHQAQLFHEKLNVVSQTYNRYWPKLLGEFFASSYFTGQRADTSLFIKDAVKLDQWSCSVDSITHTGSVTKKVFPNAMQVFCISRLAMGSDTVAIKVNGVNDQKYNQWAVYGIMTKNQRPYDTLLSVHLQYGDSGTYAVPHTFDWDRLMIVMSNAHPVSEGTATVSLLSSDYCRTAVSVYPNPLQLHTHRSVCFEAEEIQSVAVYTVSGDCIAFVKTEAPSSISPGQNRIVWDVKNTSNGKKIVPGTYIAIITCKKVQSNDSSYIKKKLLVVP